MLNNRKVRLMTQLAMYEKNEGKEDMKLSKYFKIDYARFNVLKTAVVVTIAYVIIVGLVLLYKLQYILDNILNIDYKAMGWTILGIYIGVMSFYIIITLLGYSLHYKASRKKLGKYYKMLGRLKTMYNEEDAYAEGIISNDYYEGEDDTL